MPEEELAVAGLAKMTLTMTLQVRLTEYWAGSMGSDGGMSWGPGGDQQCPVDLPGSRLGREDGRQELEGSEGPRELLLFKEGTPEYISRLRGGPQWGEEEEGGEELAKVPVLERQGPGSQQLLCSARPQAWPSLLAFRCHGRGGVYCGTDFPECPLWSFGCLGAAGAWAASLASASG